MKFLRLLADRQNDPRGHRIPTAVFLGDSVTHGCFELLPDEKEGFVPVFDRESVYHARLAQRLRELYPAASVNWVNAGISGDSAVGGNERLERDVLSFHPDLCVVCFGLNDVNRGDAGIKLYREALHNILSRIQETGCEVMLLTPNMLNTKLDARLTIPKLRESAQKTSALQAGGTMDRYMDAARAVASSLGVPVCDAYAKWKELNAAGIDTDALLSNHINHPTRSMHALFAEELLNVMLQNDQ